MPMYDRICNNNHQMIDCWEPVTDPFTKCNICGVDTKRVWLNKPATVVQDSIEGGIEIRHGLCNSDGTPKRYYSHSEIAAEAKRRGLVNLVEHVPERGSDKSKHTTRWTAPPVITEEERLKHWYATEEQTAVSEVDNKSKSS
jgi:hypothetical protein